MRASAIFRTAPARVPLKSTLLFLSCTLLTACALFQRPPRPVHAPPEEAARVQFPLDLPKEERLIIPGTVLKAVQLAMEDFLPWNIRPHRGATPEEVCLYQRESYDVTTAPGPDGVLFVRFTVKDGACNMGGVILDMGATYAVDVNGWRILATQR
jgi:hypothetical protein